MLDPAILGRASKILKVDGASDVIEHCLKEVVRRASLKEMADSLGKDPAAETPPRRRSA
jgi:hypothetical protein